LTLPTFSIVVPTLNRPEALRSTVSALMGLDYEPSAYEIIVVDDGSESDARLALDAASDTRHRLAVYRQERLGVATARNAGARRASGEILLFCDDDIVLDPACLNQLLETRSAHRGALINGAVDFAPGPLHALEQTAFGRFRIALERSFRATEGFPRYEDACVVMPALNASNLAVDRDAFWRLNGFDQDFPAAGAEDLEFSLRAGEAGHELLLDPRIRCLHNDTWLTCRDCCAREERHAQGMPVLARKHPSYAATPYIKENTPITAGDGAALMTKKLVKQVLAWAPVLSVLHRVADLCDRFPVPDPVSHRLYTGLYGLHLFRGLRRAWK
jgi:GT2 family glycosyltransferase